MFKGKKVEAPMQPASSARIAFALRAQGLVTVLENTAAARSNSCGINGMEPASGDTAADHRRVERHRRALADAIGLWAAAGAGEREILLIQIRARQDSLGMLRQRNLSLFAHPSSLSWVDSWSPDA